VRPELCEPMGTASWQQSHALERPPAQSPRLLDRLREAPRVRHRARGTEQAYAYWVRRFILHHGKRHPAEMGEPEVNAFLTALAVEGCVSASTQNQALAAILFLYESVFGQPLGRVEGVVRARWPKRLPVVLTPEEVGRVLAGFSDERWLVAMLLYGAGLRLLEALRLRVKDVDFSRWKLTIREAKGNKDRVTMLPGAVADPLARSQGLAEASCGGGEPQTGEGRTARGSFP